MIEVSGEWKSPQEIRQKLYENIVDEAMYVARGSEGAVSLEWLMNQPIFIRKRYLAQMKDEIAERKQMLNDNKRTRR
jgi:hypothetical protein